MSGRLAGGREREPLTIRSFGRDLNYVRSSTSRGTASCSSRMGGGRAYRGCHTHDQLSTADAHRAGTKAARNGGHALPRPLVHYLCT
jgi:hypothetical protein